MSWMKISESIDWIVDYDRERGMYRVSYFEDNHFIDECFFDAYEEKEVDNRIEKIVEKLEQNKATFKEGLGRRKYLDGKRIEYYLNLLINWIKDLSKCTQK